jgi:hypothetical protein
MINDIYSRDMHLRARHDRAILLGEYIADAFIFVGKGFSSLFAFFHQKEIRGPDDCTTREELINYANSISHREPSFAADLIAAANRG